MRPRNNRPYRLPARFASFEFIFPVEFKFSSNMRRAQLVSLLFNYVCCPISPRAHARHPPRHPALLSMSPHITPFLQNGILPAYISFYQRISKAKGLPSDWTGGPSQRSSEFRSADGLLTTDGRDDTELHESQSYWKVQNTNIYTMIYSHSFTLVCRGAIPVGSSLVVGFVHLAAESLRVSSRRRLGQTLGQIRNYFETASPQFHFCPGDKNSKALRSEIARKGCQNGCFPSLAPV